MDERKYYIIKKPFVRKREVYRWTLFSGKVKEIEIDNDFDLFFYEENGAFYEFFSGCCLGKYEDVELRAGSGERIPYQYKGHIDRRIDKYFVNTAKLRIPRTDLTLLLFDHDGWANLPAKKSATEFAQAIRPLLVKKDILAYQFKTFLANEQTRKIEEDNASRMRRENEKKLETNNQALLDRLIEERRE